MKKLSLILLMFCAFEGRAQKQPEFRLNIYGSYVFDDRVDSYYSNTSYYEGTVKGNLLWGLGVEYMIQPTMGIELTYLREDTKAPTTYYDDQVIVNNVKTKEFDLGINYLMLGTTKYFPLSEVIEPFFGLALGIGIINGSDPSTSEERNATKFAWTIKGGTNIWASEKVGIKLQAGLTSIAQGAGGGIYFGTGGVSPGLSTYSSIFQFSLGGGVVFKLGGKRNQSQQ
ncbi:outer membrane beta-barrel protein [Flavitalea sp.]|nr:outer membrane beta-barrel protein [Flavitalea sp.]